MLRPKIRSCFLAPGILIASCVLVGPSIRTQTQPKLSTAEFAALVERLSEPGGEFGGDSACG